MLGLSLDDAVRVAEKIPGPVFNALAPIAAKHGMYIACPMMQRWGGRVYNSVAVIDRMGKHAGSYFKVHPTIWEIEAGTRPGTECKVFRADFGTIGFTTCFDLNYEGTMRQLRAKGVRLVFFPSMYPGGLQLKLWAFTYGVYLVSAYNGEGSMIVDPLGRVVMESSAYSPIICKTLNLDYEVLHLDYNHEKFTAIKNRYGPKVILDVSRPEAVFMLTADSEGLTASGVVREFELETRSKYLRRALRIRREALN